MMSDECPAFITHHSPFVTPDQVRGRRMYLESTSAAALALSPWPFLTSSFLASPGLAPRAGISITVVGSALIDSTVGPDPPGSSSPRSMAARWSGSSCGVPGEPSTTVVFADLPPAGGSNRTVAPLGTVSVATAAAVATTGLAPGLDP